MQVALVAAAETKTLPLESNVRVKKLICTERDELTRRS